MTLLAITRADIADYVAALILVYTILMIIWVILSWIPRMPYNPALSAFVGFVNDVVGPYVRLFRFIPPIKIGPGALDLSPIAAFLTLTIVGRIVVALIQG